MPLPWVDAGPDPNPGVAPSWIDSLEPLDRVGHWTFGEASGAAAADSSGQGAGLSGSGGYLRGVAGPVPGMLATGLAQAGDGNVAYFTGSASPAVFNAQQWTIALWVYVSVNPTGRSGILHCPGRGNVYGPFFTLGGGDLNVPAGLLRPVVGMYYAPTDTPYTTYDSNELSLATWYHLAGSYDGTSLRIYRNAAHVGEAAGYPPYAASFVMQVGRNSELYPNRYFPGRVCDVRFYNWKLSGDDIERLYYRTLAQVGRGYPPVWYPLGKVT
jgi:hypothetical protein